MNDIFAFLIRFGTAYWFDLQESICSRRKRSSWLSFLDTLTLEDGAEMLSRNVGSKPIYAVQQPENLSYFAVGSLKSERKGEQTQTQTPGGT
jgi:hypothetical protein